MTLRTLVGSKRAKVLLFGVLAVVMTVLFFGFGLMGGPKKPQDSLDHPRSAGGFEVAVEDSRKVAGFVESYGQRIDQAEKRLSQKETEFEALKLQLTKQTSALSTLAQELGNLRPQGRGLTSGGIGVEGRPEVGLPGSPTEVARELPRLQKVTLPAAARAALVQSRKEDVHIPAGSFAEATLLTGVYAPTEGSAQPVDLRVDLTFIGPNRSRVPVQGAFLIGKASGEPNSLRVVIQLDKLSYVRKDGQVIERAVNGYVVDQDGVMGLSGQYVWRIGEAVILAAGVGAIQGVSGAMAQQQTTTQLSPLGGATSLVTGNLGKFAMAQGSGSAADKIGEIVTKRLDQVVPAIYVPNGKRLTVVLLEGVTLEGLPLAEVKNESSSSPYVGLDLDR
jgi:hypothetical protein